MTDWGGNNFVAAMLDRRSEGKGGERAAVKQERGEDEEEAGDGAPPHTAVGAPLPFAPPLSAPQVADMFDIDSPSLKISEFQRRVYRELMVSVPVGKVTTYSSLGIAIGCHSSRAIGQALRRNPFAPVVPCHRVVKTDRSIGGFFGQTDGEMIKKKVSLLLKEGVVFNQDGRVHIGSVILIKRREGEEKEEEEEEIWLEKKVARR